MCKLFVNILTLSYISQVVSACSTDTGSNCGFWIGCPSGSSCAMFGDCTCNDGNYWVNGRCGKCGSFEYCSGARCYYKSGLCDQCTQPQHVCSNGGCVWRDTYCGSGSDCPNNQFCKYTNEDDAYGRCETCPNNQDTFCSTNGLNHWFVIQDCYNECGAGSQPDCECLQSWTEPADGGNCRNTQYGCPSVSCDRGEAAWRWCTVSNKACAQSAQGGWHMFCNNDTPSNGCHEWGQCTGNSFCDYADTNFEGGQYGQCITCASIGNDCLNSNIANIGASTGVAECQHTCNACTMSNKACSNGHFCHFDWGTDWNGFCETCENINSCGSITESNSRTQCEQKCECDDSSDCANGSFCDLHSDSPAQGICHSCPSSKNSCFALGLLSAQHMCEMECFPCSAGSCQNNYYCNHDGGNHGFCEDCDALSDCTAEGLNAAGEQDCRDICKKFPTNLPTDMPSTTIPTLYPTTEDPTNLPSKSPSFSSPSVSPTIDCSLIDSKANCRSSGCAWLSHEQRCHHECIRIRYMETLGEVLENAQISPTQDTIEDCEELCIELSLCIRFTYRSETKRCVLLASYYSETRGVAGVVTGQCIVTFEPTPLPTTFPTTEEPSVTPTQFPTSEEPTKNPSFSPSVNPTVLPSKSPTVMPTQGPTIDDPTISPSLNPTSDEPSVNPTVVPSQSPTVMPTQGPTIDDPTVSPSLSPHSSAPSKSPSFLPSQGPTVMPTQSPTIDDPTVTPSLSPSSSDPTFSPHTSAPSRSPSLFPSMNPSGNPSFSPLTSAPSKSPSISPSCQPTADQPTTTPSTSPSVGPSKSPSISPSCQPTADQPTTSPSTSPSVGPSKSPSITPSVEPSDQPSDQPSITPSVEPSKSPSTSPSVEPTTSPSKGPTSDQPSVSPSVEPSESPSTSPSINPTNDQPSTTPSSSPTQDPTSSFPSSMPTSTGVVDADVAFVGNYNQVIGTNKDAFLQDCNEALQIVECRDVRNGSIILTIRGTQENVDAATQDIMNNGLILPGFAAFVVTEEYAAANIAPATEEKDEEIWETEVIYFIMGGAIVSFCICIAVFYSCVGDSTEKESDVIDLAQMYSKDHDHTDFIVPEEGGTEGGTDRGGARLIELTEKQPEPSPNASEEGGSAPLPRWPGNDVAEKDSDPLYQYMKRTPGLSNFDAQEGRNVNEEEEMEEYPKRRARPMSKHQKEIEEGLFGKSQENLIAYEAPEGGDTVKKIKVGGAAFDRDEYEAGGAPYSNQLSPSTDGEHGLYEGPRLVESTGSSRAFAGGSEKKLMKNLKNNEVNTRISLSMSDDDSEPQLYNVQHLYDEKIKKDKGGEILPQQANEGAGLELPPQTNFETNPSLHL